MVSDEPLLGDYCIQMNLNFLERSLNASVDYYKQINIVLDRDSKDQQLLPFNLWQVWEVSLYQTTLYT